MLIKIANIYGIYGILLMCYSFHMSCFIHSCNNLVSMAPILQVRLIEMKDPIEDYRDGEKGNLE